MKYIYHNLCRFVCVVCLSLACSVGLSGCLDVVLPTVISEVTPANTGKSIYTPKQSQNLGFTTLQGSSLGSNPMQDKSKICFASFFDNTKLAFPVHFEYNPSLNSEGKYSPSGTKAQGSFGEMRGKGGFCVEVAGDYPLAIFSLGKYPSYIVFVPSSGATYCIRGDIIVGGGAGSSLDLTMSNRAFCEAFFATMKKKKK